MTKHVLDLHRLDELNNFAANILLKLVIKSRPGIHTIDKSHTRSRALKGEIVTIE